MFDGVCLQILFMRGASVGTLFPTNPFKSQGIPATSRSAQETLQTLQRAAQEQHGVKRPAVSPASVDRMLDTKTWETWAQIPAGGDPKYLLGSL